MKARHALLVGAVLLAALALAGTSTAATADGQLDESFNESTNTTGDAQVGVCMIGVDSPCNGEQWDGDDDIGDEENTSERIEPVDGDGESDEVGICVTGVDSPCNGEEHDGDGETGSEEIEPIEDDEGGEAGICQVGADSPCNGAVEATGSGESTSETGNSPLGALLSVLTSLF